MNRTDRSFLVVAMLAAALALVALPLGATGAEETAMEAAPDGMPTHGGKLTMYYWGGEANTADRTTGGWQTNQYTEAVVESLMDTDLERFGARGTGEYTVDVTRAVPEKFLGPVLATGWEVTAEQITFTIREGVMFAADGKDHVMESREMTADDVAFSLNRALDSRMGSARVENGGYIESVEATGPYTVTVNTNGFNALWLRLGKWSSSTGIVAPEYVEAGANSFDNLVATGPFIVDEYVVGSHARYLRNPNYWATTTIDGVVYDDIPFIDELVLPIIPDESTRIASLRTGGIDLNFVVSTSFEDTLERSAPELQKVKWVENWTPALALNQNNPILANKDVRRALMIGMDMETLVAGAWGYGTAYMFSDSSTDLSMPLDTLPPSTQELFDYDPEKAKQMLADAGYPDGFKVDLVYNLQWTGGTWGDMANIFASLWGEIGVELELRAMEPTAMMALFNSLEGYDIGVMTAPWNNPNTLGVIDQYTVGHGGNRANYENQYLTDRYREALKTVDTAEREATLRELVNILLDDVVTIPIGNKGQNVMWWPWVQNYYGELACGVWCLGRHIAPIWIDQNMKESMGY
ncbi:MAG: ABC transporter substrate-binding protein [Spirochaetaceae bacterium]|nr:ABC transporter substrate-binding protein [Spirochaetaceae bacterium]